MINATSIEFYLKRTRRRHSTITELPWFLHMCNICAIGSISNTIPRWQSLDIRRGYYTSTLMYKCIYEAAPIRSLWLQMFLPIPPELQLKMCMCPSLIMNYIVNPSSTIQPYHAMHCFMISRMLQILINLNISTINISLIKLCDCTCNDCVLVYNILNSMNLIPYV